MKNIVCIVCALVGTSIGQVAPKTMTKLEIILQGAPAGSFAGKPKVMYRAGTQYCRIEEAPDPDQGIQGVMIIHEPDYWMVNLMAKTARHGVDPGPTFNCHMPIFPADNPLSLDDESKEVMKLEFGLELDFFKGKGSIPEKGPVLQKKETMVYRAKIGSVALALFTYGTPERPLAVARQRGDKSDLFWYSGYGQLDFDPKLFAKPENVKVEDATP